MSWNKVTNALKKTLKQEELEAQMKAAGQSLPPADNALPGTSTYADIESALGGQIGRLQDTLANAAAQNPYGAQQIAAAANAQQYLDAYRNNRYNYDLYSDPVYQQARDAAMRQGQIAAKDVAAQAATLTGGYGNSYGTVAASQQYNQYLQGVNDIVPQLEANAYGRYQDEQARNLALAQLYDEQAKNAYNKQLTEAQLGAQYGDYSGLNRMGIDTADYEAQQAADREWQETLKARQQKEWTQDDEDRALQQAQIAAQYGDYTKLEDLGYDLTEYQTQEEINRKWEEELRDRQRTEWSQSDYSYMMSIALQAANLGDYTKLEELGFDVSTQVQKDLWDMAAQFAEFGDYRLLQELGVDTTFLELQKAAKIAGLYSTGSGIGGGSGRSGGRSGGGGGGGDTPIEEEEAQTEYVFNPNSLTDAERALLRNAYNALQLTPRGVQSGGPYAGWIVCTGPDGTYYVRIDADGDIEVIDPASQL